MPWLGPDIVPRPFRKQVGPEKKNGDLLNLAENEFDVLITTDANLRYQQNLRNRKIAIVLLRARTNRLEIIEPYFPACTHALEAIKPGDFIEVGDAN